jgi:hypothetical protein
VNHLPCQTAINSVAYRQRKPQVSKRPTRNSGFALPLPTKAIFKIPGAVLAPVGISNQLMISDDGEVIAKDRLTHDQTFEFGPKHL